MGLDMYAFRVHPKGVIDDNSFERPEDHYKFHEEFFYWRKNNALHDWMHKLYIQRTNPENAEEVYFNCIPVRLYEEDLNNLENDIKNGYLVPTAGFFFGELNYDEDMKERDLEFIAAARQIILDGDAVYYDSWW
jgi:hypothetical protein